MGNLVRACSCKQHMHYILNLVVSVNSADDYACIPTVNNMAYLSDWVLASFDFNDACMRQPGFMPLGIIDDEHGSPVIRRVIPKLNSAIIKNEELPM